MLHLLHWEKTKSRHTHPPVGPGRSPRCGWRTVRRAGLRPAAASACLCSPRCPAAVEAPQSSPRRPRVTSGCSWPDDLELTSETSQSLNCFCSPNTWWAPWGEEGGKVFSHVKKLEPNAVHLRSPVFPSAVTGLWPEFVCLRFSPTLLSTCQPFSKKPPLHHPWPTYASLHGDKCAEIGRFFCSAWGSV